ncbi:MAG: hypothetical protein MJE63_30245 [Proteobacteria bacterium]|nr:hypothetical protein [Pseudomonadota bacterium]
MADTIAQEVIKLAKPATKKVTMNLSSQDEVNADFLLRKFGTRNKTATVSASLSITRSILEALSKGGKLQIKNKDGSVSDVVIVGVNSG